MPLSITDVSFNRSLASSGAASSLGGGIGAALSSQETAQPSVITGAYLSGAYGNALGNGTLAYNPTSQTFTWRANGSSVTNTSSVVTGNGSFPVGNLVDGMIVITVTFSLLPTSYKTESILVSAPLHTVFTQTTALMALVGDVQYRCLYFKNNHASLTANDVRLYIHAPPSLPQSLAIGVDPAGAGDGTTTGVAQTIATPYDAPVGVTFTAPIQAASGISLGTLTPGQSVAFWQRRTLPEMAYGPMSIVSATIGVALVG